MIATLGYSGSHGTHLPYREDDINTMQPIAELPGGYYEFPALYSPPPLRRSPTRAESQCGADQLDDPEGFLMYNGLQAGITND